MGSAYLNFLDHITGSITVGKFADLIILDKNLFKLPAKDIHKANVLATFINGKKVYYNQSVEK